MALVTTRSGLQYQKEDMEEGAASVLKSMEEMMIHDRHHPSSQHMPRCSRVKWGSGPDFEDGALLYLIMQSESV